MRHCGSTAVCCVSFRGKADMRRGAASTLSVADDAVDGACSAASKCHRLVASKPERLKEVRPGNDDGVPKFWRNWRGHDDVMQTRSIRGSGEPVWVIALLKCARTIGTRSAQSIMASGFTAAQTGRTHDRTRPMLHKRQKVLAKAAPSTHDPKRSKVGLKSRSAAASCHIVCRHGRGSAQRPASIQNNSVRPHQMRQQQH
jgi:hypothetical protein